MKILWLVLLMFCVSTIVCADSPLSSTVREVSPDNTRAMTGEDLDRAILWFSRIIFPEPTQSVSIDGNRLIITDNGSYVTVDDPLSTARLLYGNLDGARTIVEAYPGKFEIVELRWYTPKQPEGDLMGVLAVQVTKSAQEKLKQAAPDWVPAVPP
jgi:hypothetical protein